MKTLSLKLYDDIFKETEKITSKLQLARNRYINEALKLYNQFHRRRLLKAQLSAKSKAAGSMEILKEFEKLIDEA